MTDINTNKTMLQLPSSSLAINMLLPSVVMLKVVAGWYLNLTTNPNMLNQLKKIKPLKTVATIGDSGYIVLSDGSVARLLKPVVVNNKPSYNMVIDGTLRRITSKKLLLAALVA